MRTCRNTAKAGPLILMEALMRKYAVTYGFGGEIVVRAASAWKAAKEVSGQDITEEQRFGKNLRVFWTPLGGPVTVVDFDHTQH